MLQAGDSRHSKVGLPAKKKKKNLNAKDRSCPGVSLYLPRFMTLVLMAAWWVGRGRMREKAQILDKVGGLFGDPLYKPQKRRENAEAFAYLKLDSK